MKCVSLASFRKPPMKAGIVGCGAQAREHLMALKRVNDLQLVAVCDTEQKRAAETAREWRIPHYYTQFAEMMEKEDLSVVTVITPPQTHASLIKEAINHHVNLLVEKPLTMSTDEAESVRRALQNTPVRLTVNYTALLSRVMLQALSLIRQGEIGNVLGSEVFMLDTPDDPMTADQNHWSHQLSGGRFTEMLSHPIYLVQSVLGNNLKVNQVIAEKRGNLQWMKYDELHIMLQSISGVAHVYCSFNAPRQEMLVEVFGSKGILHVDLENQTLVKAGRRTLSKIGSAKDTLRVSSTLTLQTARNAFTYLLRRRGESAIQTAYKSLINSISTNTELIVTPEMACATVRIVENCSKMI